MAATKGTWIGGTALLSAALLAGTWLVAVQPTLARADETREQAEVTQGQNELLRAENAQLAQDFTNLPGYQADLEALRVGLPDSIDLSDYLRQLDAAALAAGITITGVEPGAAEAVPVAAPAAPATPEPQATGEATDPAAGTATGADGTAPQEAAPAPTAAGAVVPGFTAVPIKITVVGSFPAALAFLTNVQKTDGRLLLVSNLVGTGQADAEASGGRPATHEGDIEMITGGYLYVLTDPTQAATPAPDEGSPEPLPQGDISGRIGSGG